MIGLLAERDKHLLRLMVALLLFVVTSPRRSLGARIFSGLLRAAGCRRRARAAPPSARCRRTPPRWGSAAACPRSSVTCEPSVWKACEARRRPRRRRAPRRAVRIAFADRRVAVRPLAVVLVQPGDRRHRLQRAGGEEDGGAWPRSPRCRSSPGACRRAPVAADQLDPAVPRAKGAGSRRRGSADDLIGEGPPAPRRRARPVMASGGPRGSLDLRRALREGRSSAFEGMHAHRKEHSPPTRRSSTIAALHPTGPRPSVPARHLARRPAPTTTTSKPAHGRPPYPSLQRVKYQTPGTQQASTWPVCCGQSRRTGRSL